MYRQTASKLSFDRDELTTLHSVHSLEEHATFLPLRRIPPARATRAVEKMANIVQKKTFQKKCFGVQLLKQFILFPDSSPGSSCISVSKYDPLLFTDQHLHSVLKILQTQAEGRKIWAFIQLKMHRKLQNIREGCLKLQEVQTQTEFFHKEEAMTLIKTSRKKKVQFEHEQAFEVKVVPKPATTKLEVSTSKRTAAESDREYFYQRRQESMFSRVEQPAPCCCSVACCCCCAREGDDLWQKIQYLKYLESLAAHRPRNDTYL